ncbi:aspartate--tRNA(Asn) ligase [bacterium]|nr:aspartate--tRNA(Asn) ligase [bacterium]
MTKKQGSKFPKVPYIEKKILKVHPINSLLELVGQQVRIVGWVDALRLQKRMKFILVRDYTGVVQVTIDSKENPELGELTANLTRESAIAVYGTVLKNPKVKIGGIEIIPKKIEIQSSADPNFPIPIKGPPAALNLRLDWRFLDLRRPENLLIFQIQTTMEQAMREYWYENKFIEIHTPKLLGAASESGAELFEVANYFGKRAYLAQSPQLYKQYAIAAGFPRVFEIGPVFRANPSFTSRHDTEFTSVDVEIAWINSHYDVMAFEEKWLRYVFEKVKKIHGKQIKEMYGTDIVVPEIPFPKITMEEAQKILKEEMHHTPPPNTKPGDLDPKGEQLLGLYILKKYGHEFVFVVDWPSSVRPFYHMRDENSQEITKSFDLLFKGMEITTGAQREHRYDILLRQAKEKGINLQPIKFYLEMFKYGVPPHGGFGFGLTRTLMQILGIKNVREVTFLYRGPNRLAP